MRHSALNQLLAWALILSALAASIVSLTPPKPRGPALASGYDPARAFTNLERVAQEPHPLGSDAHGEVRDYLLEQIEAAGAEYELQSGTLAGRELINVVVRLPGTDSTGTVLLMAHYDTVSRSPGAGDDSSGVVCLLEVVHVLSRLTLRNDVLVLFTDGEELGLLGARMFARDHPLAGELDLVLNFEAIGNSGPLLMFETGPESGGLVSLLAATVPMPVANSLAAVVYSQMPNDTDLSVFRDRGVRGLNFAIAGASGYYHSSRDSPEAFDLAALAHMGDTAVRMGVRLGQMDLDEIERDDRGFVAVPPWGCLVWGSRLHLWIALVVLAGAAVAISSRRSVGWGTLFRGFGACALLVLVSALATYAVGMAALRFGRPDPPLSYDSVYAALLLLGLTAAGSLVLACRTWIRGPRAAQRARELCVGSLALWTLVSIPFWLTDLKFIGASYPLSAGSLCLSLVTALRLTRDPQPWVIALLLTPALYLLGQILGPLVQLSSQSLPVAVTFASALLTFGSLLLVPVAAVARATD